MGRKVRVISPYEAMYRVPLSVQAGEELALGQHDVEWPGWVWSTDRLGNSGWAPESYMQIWGATGHMTRDYTGRELSVSVGEELTVENEESYWLWCVNGTGESGWVPEKNVEPAE
jgi:uncharacterized protein YgiM (DUF1202 family)